MTGLDKIKGTEDHICRSAKIIHPHDAEISALVKALGEALELARKSLALDLIKLAGECENEKDGRRILEYLDNNLSNPSS